MPHECKQEQRLQNIEINSAVTNVELKNLINTMNSLMVWIRLLVICVIPAIGVLIWEVFHK